MAQESFGLFILFLIILLDIVALVFVMRIGVRHNDHNDIVEVKQSSAIDTLNKHYDFPSLRARTDPALPEGEAQKSDVKAADNA